MHPHISGGPLRRFDRLKMFKELLAVEVAWAF
jgi:hypothetical protein